MKETSHLAHLAKDRPNVGGRIRAAGFAKGPLTPREYGAALRALRVVERAAAKMVGVIPTERFNESLSWIRATIEEYG